MAPQSSQLPAVGSSADVVSKAEPSDLELEPVEGLPTWVGGFLHRLLLRAASMVEIPRTAMGEPITPVDGYFRRDRHVHPTVDASRYRLTVEGTARPRAFTVEDLRELPWEERLMVMECAGNGNHMMGSAGLVAQARWAGPSLATLIEACGGPGPATHFAFFGLDRMLLKPGYHYGLSLDELRESGALLAMTINGEPLPRARGFPVRLIVPGIYSMSHVKWLGRIVGRTSPHPGIHNTYVFTNKELRDGKWVRVQARWIGLKSLVARCRRAGDGWQLTGWAWGGSQPITKVEVTTDGGETWQLATLKRPSEQLPDDQPLSTDDTRFGWTWFTHHWRPAGPGTYMVASRAHAEGGAVQPMHEPEHVRGHFDQTRVKWRRVRVP